MSREYLINGLEDPDVTSYYNYMVSLFPFRLMQVLVLSSKMFTVSDPLNNLEPIPSCVKNLGSGSSIEVRDRQRTLLKITWIILTPKKKSYFFIWIQGIIISWIFIFILPAPKTIYYLFVTWWLKHFFQNMNYAGSNN